MIAPNLSDSAVLLDVDNIFSFSLASPYDGIAFQFSSEGRGSNEEGSTVDT
jgi:hypothetical protein